MRFISSNYVASGTRAAWVAPGPAMRVAVCTGFHDHSV
ncbi:MAG: hypothetical protein AVDCRST_MAG77-160 [uncultured Chloroflexi bacterium]|uniref:Uncharacterized protein n=1 Tax=uncultured Chloroflexota bacterium TaxID=166587 RepID=A0A6J4H6C5_9CHLR|nr:MAG: hypothetical protein AVDCRST_MAG77-160 [uncultured Chloroflexota bacterium]